MRKAVYQAGYFEMKMRAAEKDRGLAACLRMI